MSFVQSQLAAQSSPNVGLLDQEAKEIAEADVSFLAQLCSWSI
jgi:hypothetical protein